MHRYVRPILILVAGAFVLVAPAAQAARAPSLGWSPATSAGTHDYGRVDVGQTASQEFTLKNSGGSGSGVLKTLLSGSSAFSITSDACAATALGPRKSCTVSVQYAPTEVGSDTAVLVASAKKPGAVGARVALTGSGAVVSHLYWTSFGAFPDANNGSIQIANLDGSNPQTIVSGQGVPAGMAVDAHNLYWANEFDGTVHLAGLDGGSPETIIFGQSQPTGVAVGPNHQLYWTDFTNGTIHESGNDGSHALTIAIGQSDPISIAVDLSHLYWANFGDGAITMASPDGSEPQTIVSGLDNLQALALDASNLYWVSGGSIHKAGLDGSDPQTIVSSVDVLGPALAVDGRHIYWAGYTEGTIQMANLDGSDPKTIVSGQNFPGGIAVGPG